MINRQQLNGGQDLWMHMGSGGWPGWSNSIRRTIGLIALTKAVNAGSDRKVSEYMQLHSQGANTDPCLPPQAPKVVLEHQKSLFFYTIWMSRCMWEFLMRGCIMGRRQASRGSNMLLATSCSCTFDYYFDTCQCYCRPCNLFHGDNIPWWLLPFLAI